jgi:hypothetical protein
MLRIKASIISMSASTDVADACTRADLLHKERQITFGQAERDVEEHLDASCNSRIFGKEAAQRRDSTGSDRRHKCSRREACIQVGGWHWNGREARSQTMELMVGRDAGGSSDRGRKRGRVVAPPRSMEALAISVGASLGR